MDNKFYVYEWFNKDTNEVFYVGKGHGNRCKNLIDRNRYFLNYYNKYNCDVRKIKENLLESEAFDLEIETIAKYKINGQCMCNLTLGGEGATYEKNSWNDLFRRLQYLHDIKCAMDNMPNEEDYDPVNLKNKTIEELADLYYEYVEYVEGFNTCKELGLIEKLNGFEMKMQYTEVVMLTDMIAKNIAKSNNKFKDFLKYKNEIDYICSDLDSEEFIKLIVSSNYDYLFELVKCIRDNIILLKQLFYNPQISIHIKIKSFRFTEDEKIRIRFHTKDSKKTELVFINVYDLIWGILIHKTSKPLFELIYEEILVAPIM